MNYKATTHVMDRAFEVELERNEDEGKERRFQAYCRGLTDCRVYAGSKTKALLKIRQAIDMWPAWQTVNSLTMCRALKRE